MAIRRRDGRLIIHFDYDCFYASVFENEDPSLKSVPLAVQQKQIIVTCNYEARRRGLRKLQLINEARKIVPDVVIVLGEELGRFRDASKANYKFLEAYTWSGKVERLGFDEVFMDVTDIVDFNESLLNTHDLQHSYFQLKRDDPTVGFAFDATQVAGHVFPEMSEAYTATPPAENNLMTRLVLGSHLAQHVRWALEEQRGYTSTVGISTNKLLSKLVGNLNKPKGQTTLLPPYAISEHDVGDGNATLFIDSHDIGKIPGIGFKMSQQIRNHVLSRPADFHEGLIYGGTKESVSVRDVRLFPRMCPELLEKLLGGPGAERGIGGKAWNLINANDDSEVQHAKKVPTQISIEDSYIRLDTMPQVLKELQILSTSLLKRMHTDLLEDDDDPDSTTGRRWLAYPKTIRLTTRPRPPLNADGTRTRTFNRISRSCPLPSFIFNLKEAPDAIVEKLIQETLLPMFRKLHPSPRNWNLSLVNVGVTNMIETASDDSKTGVGRDIGRMFKRQEEVLKEWKVEDRDIPPDSPLAISRLQTYDTIRTDPSAGNDVQECIGVSLATQSNPIHKPNPVALGSEDSIRPSQSQSQARSEPVLDDEAVWEEDDDDEEGQEICDECGAIMPAFALAAHQRFHSLEN